MIPENLAFYRYLNELPLHTKDYQCPFTTETGPLISNLNLIRLQNPIQKLQTDFKMYYYGER